MVSDPQEGHLRPALSAIVVVAYVGVVVAAFFVGDWAQVMLIALGLVTGALIARWWSGALSLVLPVVDIFAGGGGEGDAGPGWLVTLVFFTPLVALATALGVLARRRLTRRVRERDKGRTAH